MRIASGTGFSARMRVCSSTLITVAVVDVACMKRCHMSKHDSVMCRSRLAAPPYILDRHYGSPDQKSANCCTTAGGHPAWLDRGALQFVLPAEVLPSAQHACMGSWRRLPCPGQVLEALPL